MRKCTLLKKIRWFKSKMAPKKSGGFYGDVLPGWWPILDKYIPKILEIDQGAQIAVEEQFGALRIWVGSEKVHYHVFDMYCEMAKQESKSVCKVCGSPVQLCSSQCREEMLCDRCVSATPLDRHRLALAAANAHGAEKV